MEGNVPVKIPKGKALFRGNHGTYNNAQVIQREKFNSQSPKLFKIEKGSKQAAGAGVKYGSIDEMGPKFPMFQLR